MWVPVLTAKRFTPVMPTWRTTMIAELLFTPNLAALSDK